MKKWENCNAAVPTQGDFVDEIALQIRLDNLGNEGWEAVGFYSHKIGGIPDQILFKREIPDWLAESSADEQEKREVEAATTLFEGLAQDMKGAPVMKEKIEKELPFDMSLSDSQKVKEEMKHEGWELMACRKVIIYTFEREILDLPPKPPAENPLSWPPNLNNIAALQKNPGDDDSEHPDDCGGFD